nr:MAG: putative maturation protein [Leviviridae sp.]
MVGFRTRDRFYGFGPGWSERKIGANPVVHTDFLQASFPATRLFSRCSDFVGQRTADHALTIDHYDNRGFNPLNGRLEQGGGSYIEFRNCLPTAAAGTIPSHIASSIPSVGARALTLRARTNPSREEVSIPNFIHELKDLPGMYRDILHFKTKLTRPKNVDNAKSVANYHLSIQMGWLPMISDIRKMLHFQAAADRRILELQRLYSSRGLKRRLKLYDDHKVESTTIVADSSLGTFITVRKDIVTRTRSWGTIRWVPTSVPRDIGHQALGRTARKLVFGTNHIGFDAVQAWNALPWTWLIDWFANFDDFLEAHRNDIPAAPDRPANIMTLTETYELWTRTDTLTQVIKGGDGMRQLITKQRDLSTGSLSVTLPFLNGRQWSILGALALQRLQKR